MIDLEYIEIDGFLYPNIETGMENLESTLSKQGILHLRYLHEHRRELYRELLMTGKLADHCSTIDKTAFKCSERIQADWLEAHPISLEDTLERVRLRTQALHIADEIVLAELIYT